MDNSTVLNNVTLSMPKEALYCDFKTFQVSYRKVHGHFSIFVCVFGSIANIINICVLTSKKMRTPTNIVLTGLAFADLLVMLDYIPFASHTYLFQDYKSYAWAVLIISHALLSQIFHFVSCCLTILLAVWRFISITYPQKSKIWCSNERTIKFIILTYLICTIVCAPTFYSLAINPYYNNGTGTIPYDPTLFNDTVDNNITILYYVGYNPATSDFRTISFVIYSVVMKLLPCILLTVLSERLISALIKAKERRKMLLNKKNTENKRDENEKQADRTTRMLLAVLMLFLLTEFPQAILGLLTVIIGDKFEKQCYFPLGDLMDIVALTNSAINFILYCSMSRQFRESFQEFFQLHRLTCCRPSSQKSNETSPTTQATVV